MRLVACLLTVAITTVSSDAQSVSSKKQPSETFGQRPRLIVMADMGNEPDEMQQMMHLLLYANRIDLEGLIACSGKYLHADRTDGRTKVRPDLFHDLIDGYEAVVGNLRLHAENWPEPDRLRDVVKSGHAEYGIDAVQPGKSNEASKLIEAAILKDDPRNLYVVGNAGTNTLAQAIVDLHQSRTDEQMAELCKRIIVFENGAQDNAGAWIVSQYPTILWHRSNHQTYGYGGPRNEDNSVPGPYTWEPYERTPEGQNAWATEHIMKDHGALGARFPERLMHRRIHFLEGGGTTPWMGLVNQGLSDANKLYWGGWSGRFSRDRHKNVFSRHPDIRRDERSYSDFQVFEADSEPESWTDPIHDETFEGRYVPVWRFRRAMFNDFRGRMDWCVKTFEQANHNPVAAINGDPSNTIIRMNASPGEDLPFNASASTDPDDDELSFGWWIYHEAGTYNKDVALRNDSGASTELTIPKDAAGGEIHLILTVEDQSKIVPMVDYRRVVISVTE